MNFLQEFLLSQQLIFVALVSVLLALTYWAITKRGQFKGIGLGVMMGLFVIIVRISLADTEIATNAEAYLNTFQVFVATLFGVATGILMMVGFRMGMKSRRNVGLQIALYTALLIVLSFLVIISNPVIQKMIGIFAFTVGMATMLALVLAPDNENELNISPQGGTGTQQTSPLDNPNPGQGGGASRNPLREIRQKQRGKFNGKQ